MTESPLKSNPKSSRPASRRREVVVVVLATILGVLAVISYFAFDDRVVAWLIHHGTPWHRHATLRAFALLGKTWLQIWLLLVWFSAARRVRPVVVALVAILVIALVAPALKFATHRTRPTETPAAVEDDDSDSSGRQTWYTNASFPSGDTATACAVAASVGLFTAWPWMAALLAVGAGVGLLRVASLAHYPSDVFAGAALGLLSAWLLWRAARRWPLTELIPPTLLRWIAAAGVIVIALAMLLSHDTKRSTLFLEAYVLPVAVLYTARTIYIHLLRPPRGP